MPAWQKRQPRAQPRSTSTFSLSCTTSVNGTMHGSHPLLCANPSNRRFSMRAGTPSSSGTAHAPARCASSSESQR